MGNKLYVGNLSFNTTEIAIQDMFSQCGSVSEVMLMQDKFTGRSRGFAFVTMSADGKSAAWDLFQDSSAKQDCSGAKFATYSALS